MPWVISTRRVKGGIEVAIGSLHVATIHFHPGGRAALSFVPAGLGAVSTNLYPSVSDALKGLHKSLNDPPSNPDFNVTKGAAKTYPKKEE